MNGCISVFYSAPVSLMNVSNDSRSWIIVAVCSVVKSALLMIDDILLIADAAWLNVNASTSVPIATAVTSCWIVGAPGTTPVVVTFSSVGTRAMTLGGRGTLGALDAAPEPVVAGDGAEEIFCGIVIPLSPRELPGTTATFPAVETLLHRIVAIQTIRPMWFFIYVRTIHSD